MDLNIWIWVSFNSRGWQRLCFWSMVKLRYLSPDHNVLKYYYVWCMNSILISILVKMLSRLKWDRNYHLGLVNLAIHTLLLWTGECTKRFTKIVLIVIRSDSCKSSMFALYQNCIWIPGVGLFIVINYNYWWITCHLNLKQRQGKASSNMERARAQVVLNSISGCWSLL